MNTLCAPAPVARLLGRLDAVQPQGSGWRARCPACGGRSRKLSVSGSDAGHALLHCFAGCAASDVLGAVGLTLGDLFPARLSPMTPADARAVAHDAQRARWGAALEMLDSEATVVAVAAAQVRATCDATVHARLTTAMQRISDARAILRQRPTTRARSHVR